MNQMNWLVVYPEAFLLLATCVIALADLAVTDPKRCLTFWLSQANELYLPDGRPAFTGFPGRLPGQLLAMHGLTPTDRHMLDEAQNVSLTAWRRA